MDLKNHAFHDPVLNDTVWYLNVDVEFDYLSLCAFKLIPSGTETLLDEEVRDDSNIWSSIGGLSPLQALIKSYLFSEDREYDAEGVFSEFLHVKEDKSLSCSGGSRLIYWRSYHQKNPMNP